MRPQTKLIGIASLVAIALLVLPGMADAQIRLLQDSPAETRPELPGPEEDEPLPTTPGRVLRPIPIPPDDPAADLFSGGTISVRGFRFTGNEALSDDTLNDVTRPYLGEQRRYGALLEARDRVTRAYVDAGYISSGAVLADQPVQDGIVEIRIIEGRLTTIEVESDGRLRDRYLIARLELEGRDRALNLNDLRRRLRILKRDPNIEMISSELTPGAERGDSVLTVSVEEANPWAVSGDFDNYITPAVGGRRGRFTGGYRNLTGWGDQLSLTYSVAKGLNDLDGRMTVPITRWDTLFELRVRQGWSEIVEFPLRKFDIKSRTHAFSLRLQQPVLRERTHAVGFFFAAEWKRGKSTLLGGLAISLDPEDDGVSTVSALRAGAEGWWRGRPRALSWRLTLSQGLDILRAGNDDLDLDGKFQSALLQMQAVEFLPWYGLRILTRLDAQIADDELVGLEQFPVGGHGSVRGFRENLLVRDEGVAGSLELRIPLPTFWKVERLELGLYSDAGYAVNRKGKSSDRIWSIGLGLHADVTRYASLSFEWAESLDDPSGDLVGNNIQDDGVHFSLHLRFP